MLRLALVQAVLTRSWRKPAFNGCHGVRTMDIARGKSADRSITPLSCGVHLPVVIGTPRRGLLAAFLIYRLAAHIGRSHISIFETDDATALAFNMMN